MGFDYFGVSRSTCHAAFDLSLCSPDVVNRTKESGTVLLAASDEQVVPQRVELVSVCHESGSKERIIMRVEKGE